MTTPEEREDIVLRLVANFDGQGFEVNEANQRMQQDFIAGRISLSELLENTRDYISYQKQQRLAARSFALSALGLDKFKTTEQEEALAVQLINHEITIDEFLRG